MTPGAGLRTIDAGRRIEFEKKEGYQRMGRFAVILPAAGRSSRFGDPGQKKIYADLEGKAVWLRAVEPFANNKDVGQILIAIAEEDREMFERRHRDDVARLGVDVLIGGAERSDTVAAALRRVKPECDFVAVHDAARPCLTPAQVAAVFAAALEHGAALLAAPVVETVKRASADRLSRETIPRDNLHLAQTPQVFRREWLIEAHENQNTGAAATDDTQLVEALGHPCAIVPSNAMNIKITTQADMGLARAILQIQAEERA